MTDAPAATGPVRDRPRSTVDDDRQIRLLLVEDDDGDAVLVSEHLQDAGLDVALTWVRTLDEAVASLDVDCVLLDLGLPDATGIPALERLLAAGAPAVVVLTGQSGGDTGVLAVAAGAQDYLVKDEVDGHRLSRAVRYAVQRRRLEATDRELYRSLVRAEETNRLERALLPTPMIRDERLEVRVGYRAGRDGVLGGDFYDVVERPDGTVLAIVGDVCGHGPDEAALGATLRTAWRTLVLTGTRPADIFGLLEVVLEAERPRPEVFTTVAMFVIPPGRRTADMYLAGHPVPLVLGPPSELPPTTRRGRALGIPVGGTWHAQVLDLGESWRLLMYTDGLLEATVGGGPERLGKAGLLGVVDRVLASETGPRPAADPAGLEDDLVGRVLRDVRALHGGDLVDDAAIVVLGWGE
ncbi:PP2C family protein-serine/threonine phosphatase [Cellulomonas edaphi]|uniref:SpoIIE family protein phosphatase n=1 Tax=Cellulomonas edaphi TaxID=3053468 RepID=A0ABT7S8X9_9CELL|nr:SpoIIE family protein phosphatase [Cellulomons edaphi]MDM7832041.1 SpoIIE family protein phosphatase [Cellulomons edaphi]